MIFAIFIGLMLGLRSVEITMAVIILMAMLVLKLWIDVKWERLPFLGDVSPYVVYCRNLERMGEIPRLPWISYGLQLFVFGGLLGGTAYAVVSMFMS